MGQPPVYYYLSGVNSGGVTSSYQDYIFSPYDVPPLLSGTYYIAAFLLHGDLKAKDYIDYTTVSGDNVGQYSDGKLPIALGGNTPAQSVNYSGQGGVANVDFSLNGNITGTTIVLLTTTTVTSTTLPPSGFYGATIEASVDVGAASLAVDSGQKAHISYYDATNKILKYITNVSGSWVAATIDNTGDVGSSNSIVVAPNNTVYISYCDSTNGRLKLASKPSGGSWSTSTIDDTGTGNGIGANSIAVDSSGNVYIGYHYKKDSKNAMLKYANNLSGWSIATVEANGDCGDNNAIAIDRSTAGKIHIAYWDNHNNKVRYANGSAGGGWSYYSITEAGAFLEGSNSLAIDSLNHAYIAFFNGSSYSDRLASNASGSWTISSIGGSKGDQPNIAIDSVNSLHISYNNFSDNLIYTTNKGGGWNTYIIDAGHSADIAIDNNDKVHVIYGVYDSASGRSALRYATNK